MAANNYCGFTYGGTQYGTPTPQGYPAAQGYAVAQAPPTTYSAPRAGYDQAYQAAATQGSFASAPGAPTYDYGYGRTPQTYDTSKTYYQQAAGTAPTYAAPATNYAPPTPSKTHYSAPPVRNIIPPVTKATPTTNQSQTVAKTNQNAVPKQTTATSAAAAAAAGPATYSNYDAALYSAATMYVAQQQTGKQPNPGWQQQFKKPGQGKPRAKPQPRPQQLHYCEVCKISCAGPQTYREHLEGQKHKKREASLKLANTAATASQNRGNNYHCELCDVTCTGTDAYAAHVRGSKHQKVVKLHQKLGKPIPSVEPKKMSKINFVPAEGGASSPAATTTEGGTTQENTEKATPAVQQQVEVEEHKEDDIKPVGSEYIEEIKDDEGKILSFNCKLCECKFNDPNAKEMHMKGRRHRLQYKRKVQPDLVVDFKPTPRQRRLAEARAQRALMQADYWNSRRNNDSGHHDGEDDNMYWEEHRRFGDEFDYMSWMQRGGFPRGGPPRGHGPPMHPFFGMMPGRRPESSDDRHVIAHHAEIYPKEEELQTIQRIVSHTERALKFVSDALTDTKTNSITNGDAKPKEENKGDNKDANNKSKEDGRDNQMFSFQKDAENAGNIRILKGVMRVGLLAKGLLLQGDNLVQLVVLCAEKPTLILLKRVAKELPIKLKEISTDQTYSVSLDENEGAVMVTDGLVTVKVSLTSPLVREQDANNVTANEQKNVQKTEDLLSREPCLQALAALRHAKWFQARATGLQSCVMVMRILRDLCQRVGTWDALDQWAMELLVEKVISSASMPLSPGDCLRRVMEAISTGFLINGPGILDPCEKEPHDALAGLSKQQREDLTVSAQQFLRYIAFRQIFKVLGMDPLPAPKFQSRPWRLHRKRRRSGDADNECEGKISKKDNSQDVAADIKMETDAK